MPVDTEDLFQVVRLQSAIITTLYENARPYLKGQYRELIDATIQAQKNKIEKIAGNMDRSIPETAPADSVRRNNR